MDRRGLGWAIGGPIGAILGFVLGTVIDRSSTGVKPNKTTAIPRTTRRIHDEPAGADGCRYES